MRAAWELFHEKGYVATTIDDVVAKAGVTESAFYNNFTCKSDLEYSLGELFDRKYSELMTQVSPRMNHYELLLYLNQELFRMIESEVPLPLLRQVYTQNEERAKNILNQSRFYYNLIPGLIQEAQNKGEFCTDESAQEIADNYFSLERGIIYDWCVKDGADSLTKKGQRLMQIFLKELVA
ncbi:TetR/AcrR family transcriptional regulator [Agathobacter sp.]|uniref:TetR/AcrR family transcriptional regulator n=1 Tax=Agathobacter sp. TaxID=2021311 RepID=UPI003FD849FE